MKSMDRLRFAYVVVLVVPRAPLRRRSGCCELRVIGEELVSTGGNQLTAASDMLELGLRL